MSTFVTPVALFNLGGPELMLILLIVLLLFGGAKLPQLAKGLGQAIREFKKASNEEPENKSTTADAAKSAETKKPGNGDSSSGAN
jgi:sec-independent protein translocase protein TatA